ncbi:MAG: hypothetical protein ACREQV_14425 [Candidatus Binatia bacterium]
MPKTAPVGWVFLARHRREGITVRWQRGDRLAYVLEGKRVGDHSTTTGLLDTVPVSPAGWVDLAEVRLIGEKWVRSK